MRKIKKYIKEKYNINLRESTIKRYSNYYNIVKNEKYSDIERRKILYLYKNVKNTNKLINYLNTKYKYNFTLTSIYCYASENGVKKINKKETSVRKISKNQYYEIKELYENKVPVNDIMCKYNYKTRNSIYQILESCNVKRRKNNELRINSKTYKDFSMNLINSKFKAYFLGLMYTDGYVYKCKGQNYIQLSLKDKDVMDFIAKNISCKVFKVKKKNYDPLNRIQLHGLELVNQLINHGCVQNKSHILKPIVSDSELKYFPYILRGIIDGDGWIRKDGKEFFVCSASLEFMEWVLLNMKKCGFINLKITKKDGITNNKKYTIFIIRSGKMENIEILKNKVYDKQFGMCRKYNRLYQIKI